MTACFYLCDYEQTDMLSGSTLTMSAAGCLRLHSELWLLAYGDCIVKYSFH